MHIQMQYLMFSYYFHLMTVEGKAYLLTVFWYEAGLYSNVHWWQGLEVTPVKKFRNIKWVDSCISVFSFDTYPIDIEVLPG